MRDEATRQKLRTNIGPVGIILYVEPFFHLYLLTRIFFSTLFNSKGLEYDDVSSVHHYTLGNTSRLIRSALQRA